MTRLLLVDLVPVVAIGYLMKIRSRARPGVRVRLSLRGFRSGGGPDQWGGVAVSIAIVLAIVIAPNGRLASAVGIGNAAAVVAVVVLVQGVGVLLHNRTRACR